MRLYLAAIYHNMEIGGNFYRRLPEYEKQVVNSIPNMLESYHYIDNDKKVGAIRRNGHKVFLDSGAFSAFTLGVTVDLPKYCRYIQKNADVIEVASVLDGIGDAQKTYENQCAMEALGTKPLPCFHYGEDERYLEHYVKNYEYITLGGMVPISTPQLFHWLDRLWDKHLTDGSGRPRLKVHGFGLTSIPLMNRYPWYSVDSSSWVQISSVGSILLPRIGVVAISNESPSRKVRDQHLDTLPAAQRAAVIEEIAIYGIPLERLRTEYLARRCFNILAYRHLNDLVNETHGAEPAFRLGQPELFDVG